MRVHSWIGKAVALALFTTSLSSCGLLGDPNRVAEDVLGSKASPDVRAFYEAREWQKAWDGKAEKQLVEIIEIPEHPFFVAGQFHPEFRSRPTKPHPLFRDFIAAAKATLPEGTQRALPLNGADKLEEDEVVREDRVLAVTHE